jgi:hypothetical protein
MIPARAARDTCSIEAEVFVMKRLLCAAFATLLLAACATDKPQGDALEQRLDSYESTLRFGGDLTQAVGFLDPEWLKTNPISELELERLRQVTVTGYQAADVQPIDELHVMQVVRMEVVNNHTQQARAVLDRQTWRYDPESKVWWLTSGLPDITPR